MDPNNNHLYHHFWKFIVLNNIQDCTYYDFETYYTHMHIYNKKMIHINIKQMNMLYRMYYLHKQKMKNIKMSRLWLSTFEFEFDYSYLIIAQFRISWKHCNPFTYQYNIFINVMTDDCGGENFVLKIYALLEKNKSSMYCYKTFLHI